MAEEVVEQEARRDVWRDAGAGARRFGQATGKAGVATMRGLGGTIKFFVLPILALVLLIGGGFAVFFGGWAVGEGMEALDSEDGAAIAPHMIDAGFDLVWIGVVSIVAGSFVAVADVLRRDIIRRRTARDEAAPQDP